MPRRGLAIVLVTMGERHHTGALHNRDMKGTGIWATLILIWNLADGQTTPEFRQPHVTTQNSTTGNLPDIKPLPEAIRDFRPNIQDFALPIQDLRTIIKDFHLSGKGLQFTFIELIKFVKDIGIALASPIFPGTDWCGVGDRARSEKDLGTFYRTDKCCRYHDKCPNFISERQTKTYDEGDGTNTTLTNNTPFTMSDCRCDSEFHECLKAVNSPTSNLIGYIYFNLLHIRCVKRDVPQPCLPHKGLLPKTCPNSDPDHISWRIYNNPRY